MADEEDKMLVRSVTSFGQLIAEAGALQARTGQPRHLYRGQSRAWATSSSEHVLLPSFYRKGQRRTSRNELDELIQRVSAHLAPKSAHVRAGTVAEILLQHYEHAATRVLDCTQVLHVAASFALAKNWAACPEPAVVYVINATQAKLNPKAGKLGAAIVPALTPTQARRPQVQAAWALYQGEPSDQSSVDFGRWVVAAFLIDQSSAAHFWDGFAAYPCSWLMDRDTMDDWFLKRVGLPPVATSACGGDGVIPV